MTDLPPFPDVEQALLDLLADLGRIVTRVPADLAAALVEHSAVHRITCLGGVDDRITDVSRVDVDTFAATKARAAAAAELVRQRLVTPRPHVLDNGVVIDRGRTDTKPHEVPWTDTPPPFRYTASYTISARR